MIRNYTQTIEVLLKLFLHRETGDNFFFISHIHLKIAQMRESYVTIRSNIIKAIFFVGGLQDCSYWQASELDDIDDFCIVLIHSDA